MKTTGQKIYDKLIIIIAFSLVVIGMYLLVVPESNNLEFDKSGYIIAAPLEKDAIIIECINSTLVIEDNKLICRTGK